MSNNSKNGNMVGGLVLICLGIIFSFRTFFDINLFSYIKNVWPLGLVALGAYIILKEKGEYDRPNNNGPEDRKTDTHF